MTSLSQDNAFMTPSLLNWPLNQTWLQWDRNQEPFHGPLFHINHWTRFGIAGYNTLVSLVLSQSKITNVHLYLSQNQRHTAMSFLQTTIDRKAQLNKYYPYLSVIIFIWKFDIKSNTVIKRMVDKPFACVCVVFNMTWVVFMNLDIRPAFISVSHLFGIFWCTAFKCYTKIDKILHIFSSLP